MTPIRGPAGERESASEWRPNEEAAAAGRRTKRPVDRSRRPAAAGCRHRRLRRSGIPVRSWANRLAPVPEQSESAFQSLR